MPPAKKTSRTRPAPAKVPAKRPQRPKPRKGIPRIKQTTAEAVDTELREIRLLQMAADGYTLQEMADAEGYADKSGPCRALQSALAKRRDPKVDELRATWNARYEIVHLALFPRVLDGDDVALDKWLRLAADVIRTNGLARPVSQHVTHEFAVAETPEERRAQLRLLLGQAERARAELTSRRDDDAAQR